MSQLRSANLSRLFYWLTASLGPASYSRLSYGLYAAATYTTSYATLLLSARSLMSGTMVTRVVTSRAPISDTPLERKRTPKEQCDTVEINLRTRRRRRF